MRTIIGCLMFGIAGVPVFAQNADSPAAKKNAILKEYEAASARYVKRLEAATSTAKQGEVFRAENPQPAAAMRLLELARSHPKDPVAYESLVWILQNTELGPAGLKPYAEAIELLATQHVANADNARLLEELAQSPILASERLLAALAEKHPSILVRGRAGYHHGRFLKNYCSTVELIRVNPKMAKSIEDFIGSELTTQLKETDTAKMLAKADAVFTRVQKEYPLIAHKKMNLSQAIERELFELRNLWPGKTAPDIEGESNEGKKIKLSGERGKVVVLFFWGTWCPHCMNMIPHTRALQKRYEGQPFTILGVNSDADRDKLKLASAKHGIAFPSFFDGGNSEGPIATRWNIQGWPTIYVIDPAGVIRYRHVREEVLDRVVEELVKEATGKR